MKVLPRRRGAVLVNSALGVALLGGAALAYTTLDSGTSKAATGSKVRTATVAKGTVQATVSGSGTLFSPSDAAQDFTTGGRLTAVKVAVGDAVKKGQVLATVDTAAAQQQVDQAQSALNTAEANLTKAEAGETVTTTVPGTAGSGSSNSGRSGSGSGSGAGAQSTPQPTTTTTVKIDQAQVASAQQQVDNAEATLANAKDALAGTTLTATTDGTVASITGKVGESVSGTGSAGSSSSAGGSSGSSGAKSGTSSGSSSSTPTGFIVLTNPAGMEVTANFSELDSLKLKKGQAATVTLNAQSDTKLDATVLSVSSLPSSSTNGAVQYGATLQIGGDTSALRTGLSATISVTTGSAENALSVPTAALQGTGSTRTATVVHDDGSTERVQVAVGIEGDSTVQVTDGLTEGEKVELTSTTAGTGNGFPSGQFPGLNGGAGGFGGGTGGFGGGTGGSRSGGGGGTR
ncbi:efflux RND transporter periplasmic adaptor subunit [Kitasatospora sp. YST-16]|uniref:efflux RND transporter periplasmic adaptor subunit n=1 Tax=Kitasatospora sp. YST-16 TaxID=2998080 RepID=UPI002284CCF6|nr:efflux RND transporter periplasmic adaptor subunit [Kitasatospora sp. YST-16]WAL72994.1 efflux RND transporter periplasmic adaptor subunit [Kitasatospora sp. YST-16]WNW39044.1 efflux RND transporter periplasmic adaptor subunit [Streptomyces sp. Li-HN-5-13]